MSNVQADYYPRKIDQSVRSKEYGSQVVHGGPYECNLGTPSAVDTDGILDGTTMVNGSAVTVETFLKDDLSDTCSFGRNITAVASAANTRTATITGRDYLGAVTVETITLNGNTAVAGKKAFMFIDKIVFSSAADTTTVDVGYGDVLGLPVKIQTLLAEYEDNAAATAGTFVAGLANGTTSTATTADVRGTYDPDSATDGSKAFILKGLVDRANIDGNAQFAG